MSQKLFRYIGRVPTNVCWNGVSFPVAPKDILKCYPEFIAGFIPKKLYMEVSSGEPRHTFGHQPFFMKKDPTGGLPMRSSSNPGPRLKDKMPQPISPALVEETAIDNPYDLGVDPKLEISTDFESTPAPKVEAPEPETVEDDTEVDFTEGDSEETETTETIEETTETIEASIPSRTDIRKKNVEELRSLAYEIRESGCPLNPDKMAAFEEITDDTVKGVIFTAVWEYYGYDNNED